MNAHNRDWLYDYLLLIIENPIIYFEKESKLYFIKGSVMIGRHPTNFHALCYNSSEADEYLTLLLNLLKNS